MNQTRQGIKMEHNPGGNPAMHPGMQPAGMGAQVRSDFIWPKNICSCSSWTHFWMGLSAAWFHEPPDGGPTQQRHDDHLPNETTANDDADAATRPRRSRGLQPPPKCHRAGRHGRSGGRTPHEPNGAAGL